jgi:diguanylate cyclase (GGDEF)-like protein
MELTTMASGELIFTPNAAKTYTAESQFANFHTLFDEVSDAVALVDNLGVILLQNARFESLPKAFHQALFDAIEGFSSKKKQLALYGYQVKLKSSPLGLVIIVEHIPAGIYNSEFTLKHITDLMRTSDNIFHAVATAIQDSLGWKWVAVTRFVGPERLEVLAFLEDYEQLDNFEYDIPGTPCKSVIDTNEFTVFSDLAQAFPNYATLKELGAQTYAGLVFIGADGLPIGHVMAMHDTKEVNFAHAEHIINIATLTLSAHFQLCCANDELKVAQRQAHEDKLTRIGNRFAFDKRIEKITMDYKRRNTDDFTLAIVDLDRLKPLNDTLGHKAGDRFIKLMAGELRHLGRQSDEAYRLGGDEFAIVFSQNATPFINSIKARFEKALVRVSERLKFPISASIGFATLSEVDGNIEAWTELADKRMYTHKTSKQLKVI